ncbi:Putative heterokaryon incompatibility [Colletotrichum destructivum]|uniref:Heterokaryon incompatibility n=1 Tax=Colletotrichum destructivum TaxID=34406 RepID=A0AAX4IPQ9_9PEZI|nr:Putative heterokaryon incompatibility [Colletotrichum destructivum]
MKVRRLTPTYMEQFNPLEVESLLLPSGWGGLRRQTILAHDLCHHCEPGQAASKPPGHRSRECTAVVVQHGPYRRGTRFSDQPETFGDLVSVARHFCIRLAWIDRFCIIHDSRGNRKVEAPIMKRIYAKAACNVAVWALQHGAYQIYAVVYTVG